MRRKSNSRTRIKDVAGRLIVVAASLIATACGGFHESWTATDGRLVVRATLAPRDHVPLVLPNYRFRLEARAADERRWQTVLNVEEDEGHCILERDWHFESDSLTYGYGEYWYVVSTDGGRSWSVWDVSAVPLPGLGSYCTITNVSVASDGTGRMTCELVDPKGRRENLVLETLDFGRSWRITTTSA